MNKRGKPTPDILGRNLTEKPTEKKPEKKQDVLSTYIGRAFRRHPLLFGLLIGYILRQLFTGGFVFS